jgi:hypothetical protein
MEYRIGNHVYPHPPKVEGKVRRARKVKRTIRDRIGEILPLGTPLQSTSQVQGGTET